MLWILMHWMKRKRHLLLCLVCLLASALPAPAQEALGERVAGKVVNALDGRPVVHAEVSLQDTKSGRPVANVVAGADGSYHFDSLPPGKYELLARASGYLQAAYLAHPPFSTAIVTGAGLDTGALLLKLTPLSRIDGRVVDEVGDPVQDATVNLYREELDSAEERVRRVRGGQTSDDGHFHFDDLAPGRFYLTANAQPWYAVHPPLESENAASGSYRAAVDPALDVAYPMVFYPNAQSVEGASPIVLSGGSAVVANMQMTPQRAVSLTLRGMSAGGDTPRFAQLSRDVFGQQDFVSVQSSFLNGAQRFDGIAPGQYTLREASGGGVLGAATTVDLTTGSVTVEAPTAGGLAGVTVTVKDAAGNAVTGDKGKLQLNLRDAKGNRIGSSAVDAKGTAAFANLAPGDYRFALFSDGQAKVISVVTVAGRGVADGLLHLKAGNDASVTLISSGNPVEVDGVVQHGGKPSVGSMVVLVPAGKNTDPALYRRDQSDLDGSFTFRNVSPGAYLLVAIDDGWTLRWDDSKALLPYLLHSLPEDVQANGSGVMRLAEPVVSQAR